MPNPIDTDRFQAIVEWVGWAENTQREEGEGFEKIREFTKRINRLLLLNLSPMEIKGLQAQNDRYESKLYDATREVEWEGWVSEDGFWDTISQIVGEGVASYHKALKNPRLIYERCESGDYTEKFAYVLPHVGDYKYLQLHTYKDRLERIHEKYSEHPWDEMSEELVEAAATTRSITRSPGSFFRLDKEGYKEVKAEMIEAADLFDSHVREYIVTGFFRDFEHYFLPVHRPGWTDEGVFSPELREILC